MIDIVNEKMIPSRRFQLGARSTLAIESIALRFIAGGCEELAA